MFPQRRRNSLSKIMRVICGFTSCVLTLATLAIVPVASSNASTEETTPKTAANSGAGEQSGAVKNDGAAEHTGAAEKSGAAENSGSAKQGDKKKSEPETENQSGSKSEKKAEPKTDQKQPGSKPEKHTSATTNTDPQNEASDKDKKAKQDSKADQDSKDKKANNAAESTKTGSNSDRSSTNTTENGAQFYNPAYPMNYPNIFAGNLSTSANNKSGTPKSKKIRKNKKVKGGYLPVGTWFEIKPDANDKEDASKWANFEGEQCAVTGGAASGNNALRNNESGDNKQCKKTKAIPSDNSKSYGVITFRPNRWTEAGYYKVHVVVHYPDGTTSDDINAGNSKGGESSPVYANVVVTRFDPHDSDLQLSIISKDKEDLKYGQSDNSDLVLMAGQEVKKTTFDASAHLGIGNINQRVICYEKDKNGDPVDGKYESGGINGLELKQDDTNVKVWKHASYDQQKKCFDDPANGCKMDDLLYDDYVYNEYVKTHPNFEPKSVNERTVGQFKGTVKKTGDFACKVYALRNSVKDDGAQNKAVVDRFDQIAADKSNNIIDIDTALNNDTLFKSSKGITWEATTLNITVRKMSYYYQPYYGNGIDTLPGKTQASIVPLNQCGVGGNCTKQLARTRHLPDGTWFEIKQYKNDSEHPVPDWASFIDEDDSDQSNKPTKAGSKVGEDSSDGSGAEYGKITVRMSIWIKTGYYYVPVVAHYPDGSSSEDEDSSNEGKPIYLKVSFNNSPRINNDDLKLRVTTEKASAGGESDSQNDDYGDVDPDQGITMMRGMRFLNPYIDAWSLRDVGKKISLKVLCAKVSKDSKGVSGSTGGSVDGTGSGNTNVWSSSVDGLTAPTDKQIHEWDHIKTVAELKGCENNPASCDAKRTLFRRDVDTNDWDTYDPFDAVERTDSIIGGAPTETGDYQCVVYALKPKALTAYTNKVGSATSVQNGDTLLNGVNGLEKGNDWTMTSFKIHVVEPFKLPKTGFAGWNMLLSVATTIFTSLMVLAFALDQTQWGRAFMKNFVYRNSAQKVSEIAVQKGTEVSARKGNE